MQFTVKFQPESSYIVDKGEVRGVSIVEQYMQKHPDLKPENALYVSSYWARYTEIDLSFDTAKASGHFEGTSDVTVKVPEKFFDKYAEIIIPDELHKYGEEDDEENYDPNPVYCEGYWQLNEADIIAAWSKAGFPLDWNE